MAASTAKRQRVLLFLFFAILAMATRFCLPRFGSCLDGDESVFGVMAYHIQDRGERPIYTYMSPYYGGAVAAYSAAVINSVLGRAVSHVQFLPVLAFAVFAGISALLAYRAAGLYAALFAGMHIIFSPSFFRSSVQAYGYMEPLAAGVVCCWLLLDGVAGADYERQSDASPPGAARGAAIGLLSGFAYWCAEFTAVMTAALFIACALRWRKKAVPALSAWIVSFAVGAAPMIYYNLTHNFQNIRHLLGGHGIADSRLAHAPAWAFFTSQLPSFFQNDNTDYFTPRVPWSAWLLFAAVAAGCAAALIYMLRKKDNLGPGRAVLKFGLAYCIVYTLIYMASPFHGETARYLLPLEPFMAIGMAAGVVVLLRSRKAAACVLATAIILCVAFADFKGTAFAYRDNTVSTGYGRASCGEVNDMLSFLRDKRVSDAYTTRFLKWMIIFHTDENIKAADVNLVPEAAVWSEYEDAVSAAPRPSFLFDVKDNHVPWLMAYLRAGRVPFGYTREGRYVLIQPAERVSNIDFMDWCKKAFSGMREKNGR